MAGELELRWLRGSRDGGGTEHLIPRERLAQPVSVLVAASALLDNRWHDLEECQRQELAAAIAGAARQLRLTVLQLGDGE